MIFGIGTDITECARFERWIADPQMIRRFFNEKEMMAAGTLSARCQHYAVRFAAKEAFSKAVGTGITGFELKDIYVEKDASGKPYLKVTGSAAVMLEKRCGACTVHVSLSHEKEYALAFVVIEK